MSTGVDTSYSELVVAAGLAFVSGLSPVDELGSAVAGDIAAQTTATLRCLERALARLDLSFAHLVKVTVYLETLGDFESFDWAYRATIAPPRPVRTTVACDIDIGSIEIDAVASLADRPAHLP